VALDRDLRQEPAGSGRHHYDMVRQKHRFLNAMGTKRTVFLLSCQIRSKLDIQLVRVIASSAPNGSSMSSSCGSMTNARQRETRLLHAAGKLMGIHFLETFQADQLEQRASPFRVAGHLQLRKFHRQQTLPSTDRILKGRGLNTIPTFSSGSSTGLSLTATLPEEAGSNPETILSNVLLPQPLGPPERQNRCWISMKHFRGHRPSSRHS